MCLLSSFLLHCYHHHILSCISKLSDINECLGKHTCADKATCRNTRGSYKCSCNKGYRGDGRTCKGECVGILIFFFHCDFIHKIRKYLNDKFKRVYYQLWCNDHFRSCRVMLSWFSFTDIDECTRRYCSSQYVCENTPGSYLCKCKKGFAGNGTSCIGLFSSNFLLRILLCGHA